MAYGILGFLLYFLGFGVQTWNCNVLVGAVIGEVIRS